MKKIIAFVSITVILVIGLSSCNFNDNINHSEGRGLKVCGGYAVPGTLHHDTKDLHATIIEEDKYGRTLFEFESWDYITKEVVSALVICQKTHYENNNNQVYYYEDRCFIIAPYEESDIKSLKENNDWNNPLNYEKMTKKTYDTNKIGEFDAELFDFNYREFEDLLDSNANSVINTSDIQYIGICCSSIGQRLYYVEEQDTQKAYMVFTDPENNLTIMKWEIGTMDYDALAEIKEEYGWHYGP